MKVLIGFLIGLALAVAAPTPDCQFTFSLVTPGQSAPATGAFDNRLAACQNWSYAYTTESSGGAVSINLSIQYSEDATTWTDQTALTATYGGATFTDFRPYFRVRLNSATNLRRVKGTMYGFRNVARSIGGGGGGAYAWWGSLTTPAGLSSFVTPTGVNCNFQTSTATGLKRVEYLDYTLGPLDRMCGLEAPLPTGGNWRFEAGILVDSPTVSGFPRLGLWLRDSGSTEAMTFGCAPKDHTIEVSAYVLPSAGYAGLLYSALEYAQCSGSGSQVLFMRIEDDGTDRIWSTSVDRVWWKEMYRSSRTAILDPSHGGVVIHNGGASDRPLNLTLVHWKLEECPCS